ncbi:hypothetical protein [Sphingobium sp. YR657]|uniref:hypothetical protein n=1 Tax=Sphingobium sp. YR657 TaxID=1884366 RepID=UPI0031381D40
MEHPPLTNKHKDFLARASNGPVEMSNAEQKALGLSDLGILAQAGYLRIDQTYTDPDMEKWRYKWTRTDKPLP